MKTGEARAQPGAPSGAGSVREASTERALRLLGSRPAVAAATALAVTLATLLLAALGALQPAELALYDRWWRLGAAPAAGPTRVALVVYAEQDIQQEVGFPLRDEILARVLEEVLRHRPRAVGIDFYRDVPIPPGSEALAELVRRDPRVVMIYGYGGAGVPPVAPPPFLDGSDQLGFNDLVLDADDVVRRALLYQDDERLGTGLSLSLQLALRHLAPEAIALGADPADPSQLRIGATAIPRLGPDTGGYTGADDGGYQTLVRFPVEEEPPMVRMGDVLAGRFAPELFRDRMVLVGVTAETHSDLVRTPAGSWPGVRLHARIASQLAAFGRGEATPVRSASAPAEALWVLVFAALGAGLGLANPTLWVFAPAATGGALAAGAAGFAALHLGWWIPAAAPAVALLAAAGGVSAWLSRRERADRAALMQLFARHVSRGVADELWSHRREFMHGGRPRSQPLVATVMFLDVRGSTGIAEGLDAIGTMQWLNQFLATMAEEAERHGGHVDDYFGDGIKVDFGVPLPRTTEAERDADAVAAVRAALSMGEAMRNLNRSWEEQGQPTAGMRVGIATGEVVAGSVGSAERLKYTIVGDTVNIAARLENLDSSQHDFASRPCRVLIAEETRARLGSRFETQDLGFYPLKGRLEKVHVHEVLGDAPQARAPGKGA